MAGDSCWQGRTPVERIRNLAIVCLVLDSIFLLVNGLSATTASTGNSKTACYEENGYAWHNTVTFSYVISTAVAAVGVLVHSSSSCTSQLQVRHLTNLSRFTHVLIAWLLISTVIEVIAERQEPGVCADQVDTSTGSPEDGDLHYYYIWQLVYTVLTLAWVTTTVCVAVLSRRVLQSGTLQSAANDEAASSNQGNLPPQTLGWPVHMQPGGPMGSGTIPVGGVPCGPCPAAGAPFTPAPGAPYPGAPCGQFGMPTWQGSTGVETNGLVAQGRPVPGSAPPDPEKAAAAAATPKTVD